MNLKINPLKPKLISIIIKYSVPTPLKKTKHMSITKINSLILFNAANNPVYPENHTKPINALCW
jgi:hypothetical protein